MELKNLLTKRRCGREIVNLIVLLISVSALTLTCSPDTEGDINMFDSERIVAFNKGGASGDAPETMAVPYNTEITLPGWGNMSNGRYFFSGWNCSGDSKIYYAGDSYSVTQDVIFTARWDEGYTVTFSLNGASGAPPAPQTVARNTNITLPSAPVRDGYSFYGWSTSQTGGTNYDAGGDYYVSYSVTLYARWVPIRTVTFLANGATGGSAPSAIRVDSGKTVTLPARPAGLEKSDHDFAGWNIVANNASGAANGLAVGATITVTRDTTFYADWRILRTVSFDGNGATGSAPASITRGAGMELVLPDKGGLTHPAGYTLYRWNISADGSGTGYAPGATVKMAGSDVILYAIWAEAYTVTFNVGTVSGTVPGPQTVLVGQSVTLPDQGTMVHESGNLLRGFRAGDPESGIILDIGADYTPPGSVTLYAVWTAPGTVAFNVNGGSGTPPTSIRVASGRTITLPGQGSMTRSGYTFNGWATATSGGTNYNVGASYTVSAGTTTLYARWTASPTTGSITLWNNYSSLTVTRVEIVGRTSYWDLSNNPIQPGGYRSLSGAPTGTYQIRIYYNYSTSTYDTKTVTVYAGSITYVDVPY